MYSWFGATLVAPLDKALAPPDHENAKKSNHQALAAHGITSYIGPMTNEPYFTEEEIRQRRDAVILRARTRRHRRRSSKGRLN